ncbi:MAG TPA: hypothetical protein PKJ37_00025 [Acidobacteriota bacterium]|jgi:hypothetical protein|nr:hypothetical protein [Acidobacteriota bacterium]HNT16265.1 hypothetical protein [Acidobacteriota bacterium]
MMARLNYLLVSFFACSFLMSAQAVFSQTSGNFQNKEHVINNGGNPAPALTSTNYQITLSSIGDGLSGTAMSSPGYQIDGGFEASYPPPGEVLDLMFSDNTTFAWDTELSVGTYNVYRGNITDLASGYGTCFTQGLTTVTAIDAETPSSGQCFFYLVTAENRIAEEGTMGNNSSGAKLDNA